MPTDRARHFDLLLISGFVLAVLLVGAVLAPVLFFGAQYFLAHWPDNFVSHELAGKEFPSYFNRAALLAALVGIWPLLKALRMDRSAVFGTEPWRQGKWNLLLGFVLATTFLLAMGFSFMQLGAYRLKPDADWAWLAEPLVSAFTVGFLEEFLFRGAVLGVLCRSLGARSGLWWTTIIFALVHFLKPPADGALAVENVAWYSGFWVVAQLFRGFGEVEHLLEEFLTLMAVGWVLAKVRLSTGGLYGSIGLHAGWVFGLKYFSHIKKNSGALSRGDWIPWIGDNLKIGLVPFAVVLLTGFIMLWLARRNGSAEKAIASTPA